MLDKIKQLFTRERTVDVPPPKTQLPRRPGERPAKPTPAVAGDKATEDHSPAREVDGKRRPAALDDPTEELLKLSDDDEHRSPGGGRNPYDTGVFNKSGAWDRSQR